MWAKIQIPQLEGIPGPEVQAAIKQVFPNCPPLPDSALGVQQEAEQDSLWPNASDIRWPLLPKATKNNIHVLIYTRFHVALSRIT